MSTQRIIILASQSPRRKELLEKMGVGFRVMPSAFDEQLDDSRHVEEVAAELALGKAREIASRYPQAIVIGADTIVLTGGIQLGKPRDEAEARDTLYALAGKVNVVSTGLAVLCPELNVQKLAAVSSKVFFKPADSKVIDAYLASGDWRDKAGSYGIQSGAAALIDHVEGAYDSVLGLPTQTLATMLQELQITCHPATITAPVPVYKTP